MQEFSSVTASSYDADALAPLLSEKSSEGWNVISIVSAGTNIVAYLSRETSGSAASYDTSGMSDAVVVESAEAAIVHDIVVDESGGTSETADTTPISAGVVTELDAVDEPAGWGSEPEAVTEPMASVEDLAAQIHEPEIAVAEPVAEVAPAYVPAAVVEPAVAEPAPVESTVPAGWYADPSGRYELRYWDGAAWTEHVSRAGQQFTDPPVA
jgi:hypothetical protein